MPPRSRPPSLVVAALAAAAALAVPLPALATSGPDSAAVDVPTCDGRAATIVGAPGENLTGTDGDDVIVTAGSPNVDSRGGDDLICTTGTPRQSLVLVDAGSGKDVVDRRGESQAPGDAFARNADVFLGPGRDTFLGNADSEQVYAGGGDSVNGGGGGDRVELGRTRRDGPPTATIRLQGTKGTFGLPNQVLFDRPPAPGVDLDGGTGGELDLQSLPGAAWSMDSRRGTIDRGARTIGRFRGFTTFRVQATGTSFAFHGSYRSEDLDLGGSAPASANLGNGDDSVFLPLIGCPAKRAVGLAGGPGRDRVSVGAGRCSSGVPVLDLRSETLHSSGGGRRIPVTHFEDAFLYGPDRGGILLGDDRPNHLQIVGCDGTVRGGAGDDVLSVEPESDGEDYATCPGNPVVDLFGDGGDDQLDTRGNLSARMTGGPGHDTGHGSDERRDVCDTEVRTLCHAPL